MCPEHRKNSVSGMHLKNTPAGDEGEGRDELKLSKY